MTTIEEALEGSTPLAERVRAAGPYGSPGEMIARMRQEVARLSDEEKAATLNAHPRIGEQPGRLSSRSLREQGSEALPELTRLNEEYEHRFGFRFVVFVNRRSQAEIVDILRGRLQRPRAAEMATGLEAIVAIAEDRLRA